MGGGPRENPSVCCSHEASDTIVFYKIRPLRVIDLHKVQCCALHKIISRLKGDCSLAELGLCIRTLTQSESSAE